MKIVFVEASSGSVVGGSLTGLMHMLNGLDPERTRAAVILYEDKPIIRDLRQRGIPVHVTGRKKLPKEHLFQSRSAYQSVKRRKRVAAWSWSARAAATLALETLPSLARLVPLIRAESPDILHACNGFRGNMDAILAARVCGIPCVVHSKGFDKYSFVERLAARGVAAGISMTRAIEEHNHRNGVYARRSYVVYDGLDLDAFCVARSRAEVRREFGIDDDASVAAVVGNIQPWKGQHVLLEAHAALAREGRKFTTLVVGGVHRSGEAYAQELRAYVRDAGISDSVVFTGPRQDVADLMNAADIVVHCSVRAEPFGRVIIEGMSVGRPVVATCAGGVPEFVRDGVDGVLVEPGNSRDLAASISRILDDADYAASLSQAAKAKAAEFSVKAHVDAIYQVYQELGAVSGNRRAWRGPRSRGGGK